LIFSYSSQTLLFSKLKLNLLRHVKYEEHVSLTIGIPPGVSLSRP
jgi:hypothetical protein